MVRAGSGWVCGDAGDMPVKQSQYFGLMAVVIASPGMTSECRGAARYLGCGSYGRGDAH